MEHLTRAQRYEIFAMLQSGIEKKNIYERINRDKSVICRELRRNRDNRTSKYNSDLAQRKYEQRQKTKPKFLHFTEEIRQKVIDVLKEDWSSEQIVGISKFKGEERVSHETIYCFVWQDKKRGGSLYKRLKNQGKKYVKRGDYNINIIDKLNNRPRKK